MKTYENILNEFFDRYSDDIYDKNWKNLYDDVFKDDYMKNLFTQRNDFTCAPYFYCKLLANLFTPNELLRLKGKLAFPLLAYSAYLAKISELNISVESDLLDKNIYGRDELYFDESSERATPKFKKMCLKITPDWDGFNGLRFISMYSDTLEISLSPNYDLDTIAINCKTLIIKDNVPQSLNIIKIGSPASAQFVEKCIFDSNLTDLPKSGSLYGVKELYLPENLNLTVPRWIARTADSDCKIYKKKGQKLQIYKNEIPWYRDHLISI